MIVYADRQQRVHTRTMLREIQAGTDPTERLLREGQWEAGVIDALCPDVDRLLDLDRVDLPEWIDIRPQEGFAYYSLYPEQYRDGAVRYFQENRPPRCVVIGIRSIGTTLSRVVADALPCPTLRFTVRPRGHPFDRRLSLADDLRAMIRSRATEPFLIVDEGPGLSGSSFTSVAEALSEFGVSDENIVLFPSHEGNSAAFVAERAQVRWPRHRKYYEESYATRYIPPGSQELSGGRWRDLLHIDVPVQPYHERRKYLHNGQLWKYAGLGHYGREKFERARRLRGFIPPALELADAFLISEWVEGRPATQLTPELLEAMQRYLAHIVSEFDTGRPVDIEPLIEMIRFNTGEDPEPPPSCGNAVALDARMLPHEWIETKDGWLKADALDHHDDHFYPGCTDIAWDVAAAALEFDVPADRLTNDQAVLKRVPFFTQAYRAFRIGYCTMAEQALAGTPEEARFRSAKQRYLRA